MADRSGASSRQRWTLALVCTAAFMLLLDITIVGVALPSIQRELDASLPDLQWVNTLGYSLVQGGPKYRAALEQYLTLLNRGTNSRQAFDKVFGPDVESFQKAWEKGVGRMEPDVWFTSVRHLQFLAAALKAFHANHIEVKSFDHLKEQLIRYKFRTELRERDVVARGKREEKVQNVEQNFDFPNPATAELVPSTDEKLPAGLVVKGIKPPLKLSWRLNDAGEVEEEIEYEGK